MAFEETYAIITIIIYSGDVFKPKRIGDRSLNDLSFKHREVMVAAITRIYHREDNVLNGC